MDEGTLKVAPNGAVIANLDGVIMIEEGITWTASDQEILYCSLKKSGVSPGENMAPTVYEYNQLKVSIH